MRMQIYRKFSTLRTPQSQPIPNRAADMDQNNAGGFAFKLDDWGRLDRFLVLGSDAPTYYVTARELTQRNAECVLRCIKEDGIRVVERIVEISVEARAPKNDPALFALAICAGEGDLKTRKAALQVLPLVARTGTHLFHFLEFVKQFRGWGRALREAIASWYNDKEPSRLAYQVVKYRQRDGWTHRDALRLSHPDPATSDHDAIYHWITQGWEGIGPEPHPNENLRRIWAFECAKEAEGVDEIVSLIEDYNLTREMIPNRFLNAPQVWEALLYSGNGMPMTALMRNLGKMTGVGVIEPLSEGARYVADRLTSGDYWERDWSTSRFKPPHPLQLLTALKVYTIGEGYRGSLTWEPVSLVTDALDAAFYKSFGAIEPTGKRMMLALDVSGSMGTAISGMPVSCRAASAAMAMVTARREPQHFFVAFSNAGNGAMRVNLRHGWEYDGISTIDVSPRERLDDVVRRLDLMPFGGTDCALPMLYALERGLEVDGFIVYTDNETWAGKIHPSQALQMYRNKVNPTAKLVVVGMTSNGFSIADPDDGGMLDVVGFDTAAPGVIHNFVGAG